MKRLGKDSITFEATGGRIKIRKMRFDSDDMRGERNTRGRDIQRNKARRDKQAERRELERKENG